MEHIAYNCARGYISEFTGQTGKLVNFHKISTIYTFYGVLLIQTCRLVHDKSPTINGLCNIAASDNDVPNRWPKAVKFIKLRQTTDVIGKLSINWQHSRKTQKFGATKGVYSEVHTQQLLSCVYTCEHFIRESVRVISIGFVNSSLRTISCQFFDKYKGCSWLSGYSVRLNFCSLP